MWNRIKHWWAAEGELAKLQVVSDRMLLDMGLDRETLRARVMADGDVTPPTCGCLPAGRLARG